MYDNRVNSSNLRDLFSVAGDRTDESTIKLEDTIKNSSGSPTDLVKMQANMYLWTLTVQVESSLIKSGGDAMRSVIQKMA